MVSSKLISAVQSGNVIESDSGVRVEWTRGDQTMCQWYEEGNQIGKKISYSELRKAEGKWKIREPKRVPREAPVK